MPRPNTDGMNARFIHPDTGQPCGLDPLVEYDDNDPLVKRYPWAFDGVKITKRTRAEKGTTSK